MHCRVLDWTRLDWTALHCTGLDCANRHSCIGVSVCCWRLMQSCRTFLGIISTARGQEQRGVGQGDRKGLIGEVVNLSSFGEFKSPSLPFLFLSLSLSLFHSAYRRARHWWAVQRIALCNSSALQYFIIQCIIVTPFGTIRYGARLGTLESAKKKRNGTEGKGRQICKGEDEWEATITWVTLTAPVCTEQRIEEEDEGEIEGEDEIEEDKEKWHFEVTYIACLPCCAVHCSSFVLLL